MRDIEVSIPDLERFHETVKRNSQEFDSMRQNLVSHLASLRANDWETKGAREFDAIFKESEKDIIQVVNTLQEFSIALSKKIQQLWEIENCTM